MADRFGYPRRIRVSKIANNLYFFAFVRLLPMIGNICGGQNWFGRFRVSNGIIVSRLVRGDFVRESV